MKYYRTRGFHGTTTYKNRNVSYIGTWVNYRDKLNRHSKGCRSTAVSTQGLCIKRPCDRVSRKHKRRGNVRWHYNTITRNLEKFSRDTQLVYCVIRVDVRTRIAEIGAKTPCKRYFVGGITFVSTIYKFDHWFASDWDVAREAEVDAPERIFLTGVINDYRGVVNAVLRPSTYERGVQNRVSPTHEEFNFVLVDRTWQDHMIYRRQTRPALKNKWLSAQTTARDSFGRWWLINN